MEIKVIIQWIFDNWQSLILPFIMLVLEFLLRKIPTLKDYSIINLIVSLLDLMVKNNARTRQGEKGVFKRVKVVGSKIKVNNTNLNFTNKII